jgi:esterase/lipase superfamily enzyme
MQKDWFTWQTQRLPSPARVVRWGHYGRPVLLFPTAGGDLEEIERHGLIGALSGLIDGGRIKVYSIDSVAGSHWVSRRHSAEYASRVQNLFDAYVREEVTPLIRHDCASPDIGIVTAGASIGAFNAVATLCRHPDAFIQAIGMSGTYDLSHYLDGRWNDDFYFSSPLHYLPALPDGVSRHVATPLRSARDGVGTLGRRGSVMAPGRRARQQGIPNRVDDWGSRYDHDWQTWREMLPKYLGELG